MPDKMIFPTKVQIEIAELKELRAKAELGEALESLPIGHRLAKRIDGLWECSAHDNWSSDVREMWEAPLSAVLAAKAAIEKGGE